MLKRILLILSFLPHFCFAMSVADFFYNSNQQGINLLKQHKNTSAAAKFSDKNWKGVAYYRDKQYQKAYDEFKQDKTPAGLYNQGNALAHLEKYDEAISAYTKALELKKDYPDAKFNKELLEKLKQQQNSNKNKSDNQKDKSDKNDKSDNKSDKNDKSDSKSDNKNSKDKSQDSKNNSDNAKDNKQQEKPKENDKGQEKPEEQKAKPNENTQAREDAKAKQEAEAEKATKPNSSHQTPTQVENAEVKSALSQVPDDPGGLLRNKFLRDYQSGQDND